jgi:hypothetical protein
VKSSSVSIVTKLRTGRQGFDSREGQEIDFSLFTKASRPTLRSTHAPIHWMPRALSIGISGWGVKMASYLQLASRYGMKLYPHFPVHLYCVIIN